MQKILVLAALPDKLRLDQEIREIEEAIKRAAKRDLFEIKTRTAVRPQDIRRALAEECPQIVHFCGHSEPDGSLLLENDGGNNKLVSPEALASLFRLHVNHVKCVLLNACYSEKPAEAISQYIDYVIGMNNPIQDKSAIEFARGFYDGLGYKTLGNQDIFQRAFDEGIVAIQLENSSQKSIPVLKKTLKTQRINLEETEPNNPTLPPLSKIPVTGFEVLKAQQSPVQISQTTLQRINRKQFLIWASLGSAGFVTAVLASHKPTNQLTTLSMVFETVKVDEKGEIVNRSSKIVMFFKEELGNGVILEMVFIPSGSFKMGSPSGEKIPNSSDRLHERPQHDVNVPAFFMGKFEVTQEQYRKVMGSNPSSFKGDKRPVEQVTWNNATQFCETLSQKTGRKYRLPSEAEWEYACRAGTTTPFYFGETITTNLANYNGAYTYGAGLNGKNLLQTTEVGSFPPNGFGLYDMHGNVWEWCQDTWHESYEKAPRNGSAWIDNNSKYRLRRGGSWCCAPEYCRSACRHNDPTNWNHGNIGFRVVCDAAIYLLHLET